MRSMHFTVAKPTKDRMDIKAEVIKWEDANRSSTDVIINVEQQNIA